ARAGVEAAFVLAKGSDYLIRSECGRIKAKPRIEERACGYYGLGVFHGAVINTAAAGDIEIHRTLLGQVHHRIERETPYADRAIGGAGLIEKGAVDRGVVEHEIQHESKVVRGVHARAGRYVPTGIETGTDRVDGRGEAAADKPGETGKLGARGERGHAAKRENRCDLLHNRI